MPIDLDTRIIDLHRFGIAKLSQAMSKKLAVALAPVSNRVNVEDVTVENLLEYFPSRYEDRSNLLQLNQISDGTEAAFELFVRVAGAYQVGKKRSPKQPPLFIFEISAGDSQRMHKPIVVWWFISGRQAKHVAEYYTKRFTRGTRFVVYGKWTWDSRRATFALNLTKPDEIEILPGNEDEFEKDLPLIDKQLEGSPEDENFSDSSLEIIHSGRRVPIYRKLGPFLTKRLREIIFSVCEHLEDTRKEILPTYILDKYKLIGHLRALKEINFPPTDSDLQAYEKFRSEAHRRLIFEELFLTSYIIQSRKNAIKGMAKGTLFELSPTIESEIRSIAPFDLTGAQEKVLKEIFADMTSDSAMQRLIQGDVGSGKTIIAMMAAALCAINGFQAAIMAPTEILAEQHSKNASRYFNNTQFRTALLTGSLRAVEKRRVTEEISAGNVDIVFGTHALIQEKVAFADLGLAVIDEQHRFGVVQRAALSAMGKNPDVLVMTATPIPRSLAMTLYGDLDISVIDELPPGRTPVKTVVIGEDKRESVYRGIEREILKGRQIYIIYPLVEESAKLDLRAATAMYEELKDRRFKNFSVGMLHGKMKPAVKEEVMQRFVRGEIQILVSTTVIEVGVDVPNASLMIVEHADRFGLSQLHQLRGRVGRGSNESFCVLLAGDKKTETARQRLGIMEKTSNGFVIAEKDLELRGQGDVIGTRQSGMPLFKISNIVRDFTILQEAQKTAQEIVTNPCKHRENNILADFLNNHPKFVFATVG